jgi:hypothetical protein
MVILNGFTLIIAGLTSDAAAFDMLEYVRSEGLWVGDVSVDLIIGVNTRFL